MERRKERASGRVDGRTGGGGGPSPSDSQVSGNCLRLETIITYPLGGGYVLFSPLFLTALSLSLSLSLSVISNLLFGITRPLLERE